MLVIQIDPSRTHVHVADEQSALQVRPLELVYHAGSCFLRDLTIQNQRGKLTQLLLQAVDAIRVVDAQD